MARLDGFSAADLPSGLNSFEDSIAIGEAAYVTLVSENPITQAEADAFHNQLLAAGFHTAESLTVTSDGKLCALTIPLLKGSPVWALLIPMIPLLFIGGLVAFSIVKIEEISKALLPLIITVGVFSVAAILLLRQPATEYIKKM